MKKKKKTGTKLIGFCLSLQWNWLWSWINDALLPTESQTRFKRHSQPFTFPTTQTFYKVNKSCKKYQAWNRNEKSIFWLGGETRQKKNSTCLRWLHRKCISGPVCVQIVALGWCFGDKAYLRSSWNILDGMLVLISVIDILVSLISNSGTKILGMLRVLRLLRTLRPLRWVFSSGTSKWREHFILYMMGNLRKLALNKGKQRYF